MLQLICVRELTLSSNHNVAFEPEITARHDIYPVVVCNLVKFHVGQNTKHCIENDFIKAQRLAMNGNSIRAYLLPSRLIFACS